MRETQTRLRQGGRSARCRPPCSFHSRFFSFLSPPMALQPWTAPPVPGEGGDDPASALVTTATGQVVTAAEYERRVKEVRVGAIGEGSAARGACVCVGPHSMRAHSVPCCGVPGRPLPEAAGAREGKRREGWGARNLFAPRPPPLPSPTTLTLFITRTPSSHLSLSLSPRPTPWARSSRLSPSPSPPSPATCRAPPRAPGRRLSTSTAWPGPGTRRAKPPWTRRRRRRPPRRAWRRGARRRLRRTRRARPNGGRRGPRRKGASGRGMKKVGVEGGVGVVEAEETRRARTATRAGAGRPRPRRT